MNYGLAVNHWLSLCALINKLSHINRPTLCLKLMEMGFTHLSRKFFSRVKLATLFAIITKVNYNFKILSILITSLNESNSIMQKVTMLCPHPSSKLYIYIFNYFSQYCKIIHTITYVTYQFIPIQIIAFLSTRSILF